MTQGRSATAGGERRGSGARQRGARRRGAWIDFRWRMDGDDLWLVPVDEAAGTLIEQRRSRANFEWPWRRTS